MAKPNRVGEFIGAFYTARFADGTLLDRPILVQAGRDPYETDRWGDYSATTLDPDNGLILWSVQELADLRQGSGAVEFGTWIKRVELEP